MSHRILLLAATVQFAAALHAQDVPPPNNNTGKNPDRSQQRQDAPPPAQGTTPMAGSTGDMWDRRDPHPFQDTAFASLLLDPAQAERIAAMDRRYAEEFARLAMLIPAPWPTANYGTGGAPRSRPSLRLCSTSVGRN